jgi:hypothetical protein
MHYFSPWNGERFPKGDGGAYRARGTPRMFRQADHHPSQLVTAGTMDRTGLTKTEADDLLDWLEAHGCYHYEISAVTEQSFSVRWWN